jgi:hypothetical protein
MENYNPDTVFDYTIVKPNIAPSRANITSVNHIEKQVTGPTSRAIRAERIELLNALTKAYPNLRWNQWIPYVPNAKLPWLNVVLKKALNNNDRINPCDLQLIKNFWLDETRMSSLRNDMDTFKIDKGMPPTDKYPTNAKINFSCQGGELKTNVKNPGVLNLYTGEVEEYPDQQSMLSEISRYNKYSVNDNKDDCACHQPIDKHLLRSRIQEFDNDIERLKERLSLGTNSQQDVDSVHIEDLDPKYQRLISKLKEDVNAQYLNLNAFIKNIGDFHEIYKKQESVYVASLLFPDRYKNAKIPNNIPVPSSTFCLRSNINLLTNASGNVAWTFTPFFLGQAGSTGTGLFINNDVALTGLASNANFLGADIGQTLPANFYYRYRLVSSKIKITFTSSELNTQGFCSTGVSYSQSTFAAIGANDASSSPFGNFSLIENSYFKSTVPAYKAETSETIFLPMDDTALNFAITTVQPAVPYMFVGYISGAIGNSVAARLDITSNYEVIVDNTYTDYIPQDTYTGSNDELGKAYSSVNRVVKENRMDSDLRLNVLSDTNRKVIKDVPVEKIYMPRSKGDIQRNKSLLSTIGDTFSDLAKSAIPSLLGMLPIGGDIASGLAKQLFKTKTPKYIMDTIDSDLFPDVPSTLAEYHGPRISAMM